MGISVIAVIVQDPNGLSKAVMHLFNEWSKVSNKKGKQNSEIVLNKLLKLDITVCANVTY